MTFDKQSNGRRISVATTAREQTSLTTSVADDESSEGFQHHSSDDLHADLVRAGREQVARLSAQLTLARRNAAGFPRRHRRPRLAHGRQLVTVGRSRFARGGRSTRGGAAAVAAVGPGRRRFRAEVAQRQRDALTRRDADLPRTFHRAEAEVL